MAKIFGTEAMQDFICHESLVKGDHSLYSEPFAKSIRPYTWHSLLASLSLSVVVAVGNDLQLVT